MKFWQTIKLNFTDKTLNDERITLVDGDKFIPEEKDVVNRPILSDLSDDPVLNDIENFPHHTSVQKPPPRGVLKKRCSENMQQIYRRTPMPKCKATLLKSHFGMGVLL